MSVTIPVRLGVVQRVLPDYRAPFFDALAAACPQGMSLFAGQPRPEEAIETTTNLRTALLQPAHNRHFFSGGAYLCWQSGLRDWLNAWQPEVLIVEANPRYLSTPSAVRWMHFYNRKVIGWGLGAAPVTGRFADLRLAYRQRFLKQFDALITYSQQGAAWYARGGYDPSRIFIARNAVAPRPVSPAPQRPGEFANGRATVVFVGRVQARKRLDLLLQACGRLSPEIQPNLWIIGDGPALDDARQVAQSTYPQAVFYGARYGAELTSLLAQADLFVLPGTGGLAVQQAMSSALPVIVARGDGTQSDLVRPENGWIIPPDDADALTAALAEALADPAQLRRMGQASYDIVAGEINLEAMVESFARAIAVVMGV